MTKIKITSNQDLWGDRIHETVFLPDLLNKQGKQMADLHDEIDEIICRIVNHKILSVGGEKYIESIVLDNAVVLRPEMVYDQAGKMKAVIVHDDFSKPIE